MSTALPRRVSPSDKILLYGLSAGRCACPNCRREVILVDEDTADAANIGKIAHIVAHSNDGPRGDPAFPAHLRDKYDNLILLCPLCHDIIDAQDSKYSVEQLRRIKKDHEQWVRSTLVKIMPSIGYGELEIVIQGLCCSKITPYSGNLQVAPLQEKILKNGLTPNSNLLITMGLSKRKEVQKIVTRLSKIDPTFPDRFKQGFIDKYNELFRMGIRGDALFEALHEFSYSKSHEFKRQAAGLAILTYLFEACEVFEK